MDAVVFEAFGEPAIRDVPRPEPDPGSVLVAVDRVQLSVTECWLYRGQETIGAEAVKASIEDCQGRVFGHEFCGEVVELGAGVDAFSVGDRVFAPGPVACGACAYCRSDESELCTDREIIGMDRPGALAEYVTLPADALATLPDAIDAAQGAAMQPVAAALIDVVDAGVSTGDVVVTVGAGVMGSCCGQFARAQGAREVFALDIRDETLAIAETRGLTAVHSIEEDPAARLAAATQDMGADVVFEAVGGEHDHASEGDDPLAQALELVRSGGTIAQVGIIPGETTIAPLAFSHKAVSWVNGRDLAGSVRLGPNSTTAETATTLVADGRVSIAEFITHELDGLESVERAVDITLDKAAHDALGPAQIVL